MVEVVVMEGENEAGAAVIEVVTAAVVYEEEGAQ